MCNLNICCWHDAQLSWGLGTTGASAALLPSQCGTIWIFSKSVKSLKLLPFFILFWLCYVPNMHYALKQKPLWLWVRRRRGNVWHFTLAPSGYSQDQVFTTHLGFLWRNFWRHITMIAFWRPPLPPWIHLVPSLKQFAFTVLFCRILELPFT